MKCWNCGSTFIEIIHEDYSTDAHCVICGRPQIASHPDSLAPDRAAYIETKLITENQLRTQRRKALA